jgi:hypothetical protein
LTITHPILTKIFFLFFFYPGGEHRVEKISENPKSKIERLKKNLWKHKHSEETPA